MIATHVQIADSLPVEAINSEYLVDTIAEASVRVRRGPKSLLERSLARGSWEKMRSRQKGVVNEVSVVSFSLVQGVV